MSVSLSDSLSMCLSICLKPDNQAAPYEVHLTPIVQLPRLLHFSYQQLHTYRKSPPAQSLKAVYDLLGDYVQLFAITFWIVQRRYHL